MARALLLIFLFTFAQGAIASTVTLDFEPPSVTTVIEGVEYLSNGFRLTSTDLNPEGPNGLYYMGSEGSNHTMYLVNELMILERADGGVFSLHEFQATELCYIGLGCMIPSVVGTTVGGDTITFNPDRNCYVGSPDCPQLRTFTLDSPEWSQLVSVSFDPYVFQDLFSDGHYDNIVVSNVPLPPAAWLFVSAVAALLRFKRVRH